MKTLLQRKSSLHGGVKEHDMSTLYPNSAHLAGRVLLAAIFLIPGFGKLGAYAATQSYMASRGVPAALLPLVIGLELGGLLLLAAHGAGAWSVDTRRARARHIDQPGFVDAQGAST